MKEKKVKRVLLNKENEVIAEFTEEELSDRIIKTLEDLIEMACEDNKGKSKDELLSVRDEINQMLEWNSYDDILSEVDVAIYELILSLKMDCLDNHFMYVEEKLDEEE